MALTASEELQQRKQQKFRKHLTRVLSSFPASKLNDYMSHWFEYHLYRPTADHFLQMTVASKFGTGNAIAEGGAGFLLETTLKVFSEVNRGGHLNRAVVQPWGSVHEILWSTTDIWSAPFCFEIDAKLLPHIHQIVPDDMIWMHEISPYLFLDKETQAFGFVIVPLPAMTIDEFKIYGSSSIDGWEQTVEDRFERVGWPHYQILDFDTGLMEFISGVRVTFGPVDKLVQLLPERARHDVSSHERKLKSGVVTPVRAHRRNTPLRLVVNNRFLTDHIVYCVKDADKKVRYFGEGKRDRWKHINSGVSHNWKINEHYFTKGEMSIEVLHEGLTKSEALSIERMLIRKNSDAQLWNVKDYEPFSSDTDQMISDEEIEAFSNEARQ